MKKTIVYAYYHVKQLLRFCFGLVVIVFSSVLYGQDDQMSPLNPEFVKYQSSLKQATAGGHTMGLIPDPVSPNFVKPAFETENAIVFPEKYDLRTAGPGGTSLITSVKDQGTCGSCWAFATIGAIEGYAKKNGFGTYDLSENNLKECAGFVYDACYGGNVNMASSYLARKSGPVLESADPYSQNIVGCKGSISPQFWVSDIRYLPKNASIIKQAILDYGALSTFLYFENESYNSVNHTYYYSGTSSTNHVVLLIGWDDTKVTAGGTGAWILRNSWGTSWGENGFFYISYNDTRINSGVMSFRNIATPVVNSTLFSYDKLGMTNTWGLGSNIGYGLIKFSTGNKNYSIKKLSTFVPSGPATVRFDVYQNFDGTTLSNPLGSIAEQICDVPGYYTFNLPASISVSANNDFYVKVYYNTTGYNYPIPIEYNVTGYAVPVIETGKCWRSSDGVSWLAFGADQTAKADLCINAYGEYAFTPPVAQANTFSATNITSTSATLNWVRGNGTGVMVVARNGSSPNTDPTNGTSYTANTVFASGQQIGSGNYVVYNGTGTSVNVTGLSPSQTYYFSIYEYNTADNSYKTPALTGNASTSCGVATLPFYENFENTIALPNCWTSYRGTNGLGIVNDWMTSSDGYNGSLGAVCVKPEAVTVGSTAEDWLVMPKIILPAGVKSFLTFYEKQTTSTDLNTLYYVKVSTTSPTDQTAFTNVINYSESTFGTTYSLRTVDLSAYAGQSVYIAFVMVQNNGDSWYIDNVNVGNPPAASGAITGLINICQGQTAVSYTVPVIANATGYIWTLPAGVSITSGNNTNNITVNFSTSAVSGNISVQGTNICGAGTISPSYPVTVNALPNAPGNISGITSVCQGGSGIVYSIPDITTATTYSWTLPTGASITSGNNTNSITVSYSNVAVSGNMIVYGSNVCGNGSNSTSLPITVNISPAAAGIIVGKASVGKGQVAMYSVPYITNATGYVWTLPAGVSIASGNNTNTINTSFSSSAVSGDITVQGTNGTCAGVISTLAVTVTGAAAVENIVENPGSADGLIIYPNPASTLVTIETTEDNSTIKVYSLDEKLLLQKTTDTKTSLLDIGKLPGGVYLIRVSTTRGTFSRKIIKQ